MSRKPISNDDPDNDPRDRYPRYESCDMCGVTIDTNYEGIVFTEQGNKFHPGCVPYEDPDNNEPYYEMDDDAD